MNRRNFIRKSGLTAAGALASPYILPSGRLFAPTGRRMSDYVVVVMFAGGVRQQESVLQRYLDDAQEGEPYPGTFMHNMLTGDAPELKIVYGTGKVGPSPSRLFWTPVCKRKAPSFKKYKPYPLATLVD